MIISVISFLFLHKDGYRREPVGFHHLYSPSAMKGPPKEVR